MVICAVLDCYVTFYVASMDKSCLQKQKGESVCPKGTDEGVTVLTAPRAQGSSVGTGVAERSLGLGAVLAHIIKPYDHDVINTGLPSLPSCRIFVPVSHSSHWPLCTQCLKGYEFNGVKVEAKREGFLLL